MIWTLAGLKGGTGKTTLAANLAAEAQRRGARCLLVDATRGRQLLDWARESHFNGPVTTLLEGSALTQLPAMALGFDLCLVDAESGDRELCATLGLLSDHVLIPCGASPLDVWPLLETVELFAGSRSRVQVVLNGHDPRTSLGRDARAELRRQGFDLIATETPRRNIHAEAMAYASATVEYDPRSAGAKEIMGLYDQMRAPMHTEATEPMVLH